MSLKKTIISHSTLEKLLQRTKVILPAIFAFALSSGHAQQFQSMPTMPFLNSNAYLRSFSWIDANGDDLIDVFVVGSENVPPNSVIHSALYINNGNFNFTQSAGLLPTQRGFGNAWADIENDGDVDCYIGATWNFGDVNELFENTGGGTFVNNTTSGSVPAAAPFEGTVSWGDYNNDGLVDLYLAKWNGSSNVLYRNNGGGTFSPVGTSGATTGTGWTSCAIWVDYDNDNDQDMFVANYNGQTNQLFDNDGTGNFTLSTIAGDLINDVNSTRDVNWIDVDNDGDLDVYLAMQSGSDELHFNNGNGTFTKNVLNNSSNNNWASNWGDVDNDGDMDMINLSSFGGDSELWINDGAGNLTPTNPNGFLSPGSGSMSHGVAFVDANNDGWLDIHLNYPGPNQDDYFYQNLGLGCKSWIEIDLVGIQSNRSAIGAKVRTFANGVWQMRHLSSQNSKVGHNPHRLHFGFDQAAVIDAIEIEWPSGQTCSFTNVDVNQIIEIDEACNITVIVPPSFLGTSTELDMCQGAPDSILQVNTPGGIWDFVSCTNCMDTSNNTFSPSAVGTGIHELHYSSGGVCGTVDTFFINIVSPNAGAPGLLELCENDLGADPFTLLNGTPDTGGVWIDPNGQPWTDNLLDPAVSLQGQYTYIVGLAGCADSVELDFIVNPLPLVDAGNDTVVNAGSPVQFNASSDGINLVWAPAGNLSCDDCLDPLLNAIQTQHYVLTATNQFGCVNNDTILVSVEDLSSVFIPNGFTPNGDGLNDELVPIVTSIVQIEFYIFDRWGEIVFSTEDIGAGWNGRYNGFDAKEDVYVYKFLGLTVQGDWIEKHGHITLIK